MHAHHIEFLELLNGTVQYVVPRWQRRYRWGQADIERLVEDLHDGRRWPAPRQRTTAARSSPSRSRDRPGRGEDHTVSSTASKG